MAELGFTLFRSARLQSSQSFHMVLIASAWFTLTGSCEWRMGKGKEYQQQCVRRLNKQGAVKVEVTKFKSRQDIQNPNRLSGIWHQQDRSWRNNPQQQPKYVQGRARARLAGLDMQQMGEVYPTPMGCPQDWMLLFPSQLGCTNPRYVWPKALQVRKMGNR